MTQEALRIDGAIIKSLSGPVWADVPDAIKNKIREITLAVPTKLSQTLRPAGPASAYVISYQYNIYDINIMVEYIPEAPEPKDYFYISLLTVVRPDGVCNIDIRPSTNKSWEAWNDKLIPSLYSLRDELNAVPNVVAKLTKVCF